MVCLKNFRNNKNTLECDFYPMNKEKNKCHIIINKETKEIVSTEIPDDAECYRVDIASARSCLAKYIGKETFPEEDFWITH